MSEAEVISPKLSVLGVLARGSFGVVYRARQLAVARDVAVKVLDPAFAPGTEAGRLFRDEIRAIGTIDHRNVVRIFDADETVDGRLYFVMELLVGPTLEQLAEAGPLPAPRAIALVCQLLDGLAAVHAAGHIHADIKPANAVVCGDDRVVLIDFGLSRVRPADRPAEAVGGTRAYMAPEQLSSWQVDARSDVFAAGLVLVRLLTGRCRAVGEVVPPLDGIDDPAVRRALERALAIDPQARPSALDMRRALRGGEPDEEPAAGPPPPFRELAPLTEEDRGRLRGRSSDVLRIARRIEIRQTVVLTAPSGTGKTSLLRAGLIPYLAASGVACTYLACGPGAAASLASALEPGAASLGAALSARQARGKRLVIILDQLEVSVANGEATALLDELFTSEVSLVLGVREDFVARLLAVSPRLAEGVPQVRLPALDRDGTRDALIAPLAEHGVTLEPELLDRLLDDLTRAGEAMGLEAGIYPPHLQLAGAALFDARSPTESVLTVQHYRRLGGFEAIVGELLERTLGELPPDDREIARDLLLTLVTSAHTRAVRSEVELVDALRVRHGGVAIRRVLVRLETQRLIARTTGLDGAASWSLVHDTLAPRIEAWLTVQDLDRRRIAEVVRLQLRHSQPELPALLGAKQLASIERFPGLLEELEIEWRRRRPEAVWSPRTLVQRSQKRAQYRRVLIASATAAVLALTALLVVSWLNERGRRRRANELRTLNLGRIELSLEPFDLRRDGSGALVTVPISAGELPSLDWKLLDPSNDDPDAPGEQVAPLRLHRGARKLNGPSLVETGIEVRGGDAFLSISGRGRHGETCAPSLVPLHHLLGNTEYEHPRSVHVRVPTCAATRFEMIDIPAGPFVAGGLGVPPAHYKAEDLPPEHVVDLPAFALDRTEITNDAFAVFAAMAPLHDITGEVYAEWLGPAATAGYPRANLDWFDARAYCRFLGKDLPTSDQWQKALRGGLRIAGADNPQPRRNVPWLDAPPDAEGYAGVAASETTACMQFGQAYDPRHAFPVGSHPRDASPYGVLDLAGSMQEWTLDAERGREQIPARSRPRITRGGNWFDTTTTTLIDYMPLPNPRSPHTRFGFVGARCARSP